MHNSLHYVVITQYIKISPLKYELKLLYRCIIEDVIMWNSDTTQHKSKWEWNGASPSVFGHHTYGS
jgi:hypothetical protein